MTLTELGELLTLYSSPLMKQVLEKSNTLTRSDYKQQKICTARVHTHNGMIAFEIIKELLVSRSSRLLQIE
jgi:hypothetical protein